VPTSHWAYDEIEYCAANNVVGGYGGGWYHPEYAVTRDQMAVFVYRSFIQPTGDVVVLGGPAITAVDPGSASYWGWSSLASGPASDPGYAYVVLDAVRLDTNLCGGDGFFDVYFELTGPETVGQAVHLPESDLVAAKAEAMASGTPYLVLSWHIPPGLTPGGYLLTTAVAYDVGAGATVGRRPQISVTP